MTTIINRTLRNLHMVMYAIVTLSTLLLFISLYLCIHSAGKAWGDVFAIALVMGFLAGSYIIRVDEA